KCKFSSASETPHTPTLAKTRTDAQLAINDLEQQIGCVWSYLPSVNETLVKQAAISAWKAMN
ncbi:Hypothetical protein FKW44_020926, partial [Caligus rogercresseyi]